MTQQRHQATVISTTSSAIASTPEGMVRPSDGGVIVNLPIASRTFLRVLSFKSFQFHLSNIRSIRYLFGAVGMVRFVHLVVGFFKRFQWFGWNLWAAFCILMFYRIPLRHFGPGDRPPSSGPGGMLVESWPLRQRGRRSRST
jgi:hypothetical protein